MSDRTVYGLNFSENGWRMVDQDSCVWVLVPGSNNVHLQIREGQPAAILGAWAADWNAFIEPLRDADSACWTPTNSVASSNHLSGTAIDLNWDSHPFQRRGSLNAAQMGVLVEMEKFYEGTVFWAGRWDSPVDEMHSQAGYNTYGSANVDRVQQFIARKIRADGFSTFRRNAGTIVPPPVDVPAQPNLSRAEGYAVRIINEGRRRGVTPKGIQIALATGIVESNITVYANEKLPKSLVLPHDAVGNDGYSVGIFQQQVRDTGNGWWWGDEVTCMGVESSAGLFYDRLVKLPYNGTSKTPGAFAQQVQSSAFPDRYDEHWGEAVALYNKLAGIPTEPLDPFEELLMANTEVESLSIYATPGEPNIPLVRLVQSIDAAGHRYLVEEAARLGDVDSLARIARTAAGQGKYRDQATVAHATAVLADIEATNPSVLQAFLKGQSA